MPDALITSMTQFGAAGLIGLLWVMERRHATTRDRQIDESHRLIIGQDRELDALLQVVKENTRAIIRLEQSQLRLIAALDGIQTSSGA